MIMLPYSTELRLSQWPYVVYSIILLCIVVFFFQQENRKKINHVVDAYCQSIYAPKVEHAEYDYMQSDKESCSYFLTLMHEQPDLKNWLKLNVRLYGKDYTLKDLEAYAVFELKHYNELIKNYTVPKSLDKQLMYYPNTFNPFKMLTSAISHADWSHIIFNLLFFFAFAPALEVLVGSKLKFLGVLITIEIIGGVIYSVISIMEGTNIPTLGLSGSVTGMIGFSAYMMPWARIRTLFVFFTYARKFSIPASFLAAWYIGWDVYELFSRTENGGVNVLAHVAGGFTGYFMGVLFFKERKELAKHELEVEIDYMRSKRESFSSMATGFKGDSKYIDNKSREHEAKKELGKFSETLYHFVKAGKTSEAMSHILERYDLYKKSPEIYEDLFNEVGEWKKKRVYLCLGRLVLHLYIEQKRYGRIVDVLKACIETEPNYVLANPKNLLFVTNKLIELNQPEIAYNLIKNAKIKYGEYINFCDCILLEAKILWMHLNKENEAKALLNNALIEVNENDAKKISEFLLLLS